MGYEEIILSKEDNIATVTLNRPEALNAFGPAMMREVFSALEEIRTDKSVRVAILTGAGRAFCAGGDVKTMGKRHAETPALDTLQDLRDTIQRVPNAMRRLGKPIIAAVNGPATGAGCDLSLMCDIRIASENARFAESYAKVGIIPGAGGAYLLPRAVGLSKACELLFTGDIIDAAEAERIGLVSRVVPADQLMPTVRALAAKIAANPPLTIQQMRHAIYAGQELSLANTLEYTSLAFGHLSKTEDHQEALQAIAERRQGRFKGK